MARARVEGQNASEAGQSARVARVRAQERTRPTRRPASLGLTWTHLTSLGLTWTHLHSLRLTWTHLTSLGFTWTHLDSLELTWTHLISLGLTWTHLDSLGLTWTDLNSCALTWTHFSSLQFTLFHFDLPAPLQFTSLQKRQLYEVFLRVGITICAAVAQIRPPGTTSVHFTSKASTLLGVFDGRHHHLRYCCSNSTSRHHFSSLHFKNVNFTRCF